jgi:uncharacterized iron-regulated protein
VRVWRFPALSLLLLLSACAGITDPVDSAENARSANGVSGMIAALAKADIAILGEVHDNAQHHRNQAWVIRELSPAAVVFEMLSPEQAKIVNTTSDRGDALRDALDWSNSGWPSWDLYQPVFAAITAEVVVYGMALPRESLSAAVKKGAADVFGAGGSDYGLTEPLPASQQQAREALQQSAHCNMLPESLLPGMVEGQRLRDAAFAQKALQAFEQTGGPVIVITGTGHARSDWGMPVALGRASPNTQVVSLGQLEESPLSAPPYDLWLVTRPAPREDPCEGFSMPGR